MSEWVHLPKADFVDSTHVMSVHRGYLLRVSMDKVVQIGNDPFEGIEWYEDVIYVETTQSHTEFAWELVNSTLARMKVSTGWVTCYLEYHQEQICGEQYESYRPILQFIPDPNHYWVLKYVSRGQ